MAVRSNSTTASRRGFLSSLVKLPLIGGGIALIGKPTAAAMPRSVALLHRYQAFLSREHLATLAELEVMLGVAPAEFDLGRPTSYADRVPVGLMRPDAEAAATVNQTPPSTRAAVVLAAAGVPMGT